MYFVAEQTNHLDFKSLRVFFALDQSEFPYPGHQDFWQNLTDQKDFTLTYLRKKDGEMIGFALFQLDRIDTFAHLLKLVIKSEWRGQSLGKKLLIASQKWLLAENIRRIYLEVAVNNRAAVSTYEALSFKTIHRKARYYSDGEDAYIMEKTFS